MLKSIEKSSERGEADLQGKLSPLFPTLAVLGGGTGGHKTGDYRGSLRRGSKPGR